MTTIDLTDKTTYKISSGFVRWLIGCTVAIIIPLITGFAIVIGRFDGMVDTINAQQSAIAALQGQAKAQVDVNAIVGVHSALIANNTKDIDENKQNILLLINKSR